MPLSMETTWTLRERRDGVAYFDVKSATVSAGSLDMAETVMTTDTSGEINGTVEVDEVTGLTLRMRTVDETSGTMTMTGGSMGDMVMPMSTRTVTAIELLARR